jgi:enoyl-CoA hydratase/carnithine racemase
MLLGPNRGRHFLLTGAEIDAREAQRIGFVAEVLDQDALLPRAHALAADIAARPVNVVRHTRRLLVAELRRRIEAHLSEGLMLEGMAFLEQ